MPKIRFTAEEKAKAILRHFQDGIPISTICAELSIHPNVFYSWQKQFFSEAHLAFDHTGKTVQRQHERKVAELEKRLKDKDTVIAELLEEYTTLKKNAWGPLDGWVEYDLRDRIVAFIDKWAERTDTTVGRLCSLVGITCEPPR